jgi:hypothetical protein
MWRESLRYPTWRYTIDSINRLGSNRKLTAEYRRVSLRIPPGTSRCFTKTGMPPLAREAATKFLTVSALRLVVR